MGNGSHVRGSVLVVDDEPTIADIAARYLRRAGYDASTAGNGLDAVAMIGARRPDLVVLDLMLPGIDGLEVMRRVREQGSARLPIIMLTARGGESDRIVGLSLGADDYMVKPFSPGELVARVDAVLRRIDTAPEPAESIDVNGLHIDARGRRVLRDGEEISLTQREFDLLLYLASHPGQVFSREQLMDSVWQYAFYSDTATVTVHVRRLRAKLELDPAKPKWLQTVWGVGYRFQP